jgi:hypothetical protein
VGTRLEIARDQLVRTVGENVEGLRAIVRSTRRAREKSTLMQIVDAYEVYLAALQSNKYNRDVRRSG